MPGIVVGIDGSDHSRRALEWAVSEAAVRHAPLTVLTVNRAVAGYGGRARRVPAETRTVPGTPRRQPRSRRTASLRAPARNPGPRRSASRPCTGFPVEELLRASASADLIVVASRGSGGFKRLRMGSVANQLTAHAHCPVVVIPVGDA